MPFLGKRTVVLEQLNIRAEVHGDIFNVKIHPRILFVCDAVRAVIIFRKMPDLGIRSVPIIEPDILVVSGHSALHIHDLAVGRYKPHIVAVLDAVHMHRLDPELPVGGQLLVI